MTYTLTFQPRNAISGVKPKTNTFDTAAAAWATFQGLEASDEATEIKNRSGQVISRQELRDLAAQEAN